MWCCGSGFRFRSVHSSSSNLMMALLSSDLSLVSFFIEFISSLFCWMSFTSSSLESIRLLFNWMLVFNWHVSSSLMISFRFILMLLEELFELLHEDDNWWWGGMLALSSSSLCLMAINSSACLIRSRLWFVLLNAYNLQKYLKELILSRWNPINSYYFNVGVLELGVFQFVVDLD